MGLGATGRVEDQAPMQGQGSEDQALTPRDRSEDPRLTSRVLVQNQGQQVTSSTQELRGPPRDTQSELPPQKLAQKKIIITRRR